MSHLIFYTAAFLCGVVTLASFSAPPIEIPDPEYKYCLIDDAGETIDCGATIKELKLKLENQ